MALTISNLLFGVAGNVDTVRGSIAFDASYPANGESLTAKDIGLVRIDNIAVHPTSGYVFSYDYTNSLLLVYQQTDPAAGGGADIPLVEATGANLSTLTGVRFSATGV